MLKYGLVCFSLMLTTSCAFGCLDETEIDFQRRKQKIIQKNLKGEIFSIVNPNPEETEAELKSLVSHYWYDDTLRAKYASFLFYRGKTLEGLNASAPLIIKGDARTSQIQEYMDNLGCLPDGKEKLLNPRLRSIFSFIENPESYLVKNNIKGQNPVKLNSLIEHGFLDEATELFSLLKNFKTNSYYEATLQIFSTTLSVYKRTASFSKLCGRLFLHGDGNFSPLLKQFYAFYCLTKEKRYEEAIPLYESILGSEFDAENPYQLAHNYNTLGCIYAAQGDFNKAILSLKKALALDYHPRGLFSLAKAQLSNDLSGKALKKLKKLKEMPLLKLEEANISQIKLNEVYKIALQKAEETGELQVILNEEQENALEKLRKKGKLIKRIIEKAKQLKEEKDSLVESTTPRKPVKPKFEKSSIDESPSLYDLESSLKGEKPKKLKMKEEQKGKQKTRGVPASQLPVINNDDNDISLTQVPSVTIETLLKRDSNPYMIFCNFFKKYDNPPVKDKNIQISMDQVSTLMTALDQDLDSTKGHGSHSKLTLNFEEQGIEGEAREQMVTLAKRTYLVPAQIKDIRKRFLSYGLYPKDFKLTLQKKGFVD